jgi:Zn-dependent protease
MDSIIQTLAVYALPVIFAITLHEAAHGFVARYFGDPTAWQLGRVSLNPLRHVDPVGTVIVPAVILLASRLAGSSGMLFGWAKPVPVNFNRLRRPKQDMLWVAAAGPAANLLMGLGWALVLKLTVAMPEHAYSEALAEMGRAGLLVNTSLMFLNLLPIPPLDGGRIMVSLLPMRAAWRFAQLERYGLVILLALLFTGVLERILNPLMGLFLLIVMNLLGFSHVR